MSFYMIFPFLFFAIRRASHAFIGALLAIFVAVILNNFYLNTYVDGSPAVMEWFKYAWLPSQLPVFLLGFALYFVLFGKLAIATEEFMRDKTNFYGSICLCIGAAALLPFWHADFFPKHWAYAVLFFVITVLLKTAGPNLIVNPVIRYLGKISFSAYLVHYAALGYMTRALNKAGLNDLPASYYFAVLLAVTLIVTILFSTITYYLIEVSGQSVGKALISRLERKAEFRVTSEAKFG